MPARVEVVTMANRTPLEYGEVTVRLELAGRAVEVRLEDHAAGDPLHLVVNERLAQGGVRRLVTERVRG